MRRFDHARTRKRLEKKAKRGFRGYPLATLAFYGPDDRRASKAVASIIEGEDEEPHAHAQVVQRTCRCALRC